MQTHLTDIDLFNQIKSGNKSSFQFLFERYYSPLARFALLYTRDKDVAEEIVQEFFFQFWVKREKNIISTSVKSYLYSSIRNRSLNFKRDEKNHIDINDELTFFSNNQLSDADSEIDYEFVKFQVKNAIESLPEKCKQIFKLSREDKLTYKQIAEKLNVSHKTVENQMGIALKKLREKLQPILKGLVLIILFVISGIKYL